MVSRGKFVFEEEYGRPGASYHINLYSEYMMMEIHEQTKGIEIGGHYSNNIRYADDAVFMSENEADLQDLVLRINDICKEYGMAIKIKKTKTMVINKTNVRHSMQYLCGRQ